MVNSNFGVCLHGVRIPFRNSPAQRGRPSQAYRNARAFSARLGVAGEFIILPTIPQDSPPSPSRCHDQSQISVRFDGNRTVITYIRHIRHQWLRNFPKTLDRCVSGQPWENFQLTHLVFAFLVAARFADHIVSLPPYQFARDRFGTTGTHTLGTLSALSAPIEAIEHVLRK